MKLSLKLQMGKLSETFKRFPLPILCGVLFTIAVCFIVKDSRDANPPINLFKIAMSASLGVPFLAALNLWAEKNGGKLLLNMVLQSAGVLILLIYAVYFIPTEFALFDSKNTLIREAMLFFGSILALFLAPYLREGEKTGFWEYVKIIIGRMIITIFFSIVLFAGLSLAILSADKLLDIGITGDNIYGYLWAIIAGVFGVIFFLSDLPKEFQVLEKNNYDDRDNAEVKLIKIFAKFVLSPLILIYAVILYVYLGKILITQDWPNGWVAMPILIFAIIGLALQFLLYPLRSNLKWVKELAASFYVLLIPVALMLILSVWKRIEEYAITEIRYLGIAVGLWLIGMAFYNLISKKKSLKIMVLSLMIIAFLASFGPWGAFRVSETSQKNRLEKILIQNNILQNGKVVKADEKKLDFKIKAEINNIVEYLADNHGVKSIRDWFSRDITKIDTKDDNWKGKNDVKQNILAEIGIGYLNSWERRSENQNNAILNFYFQNDLYLRDYVYKINGFDYAINFNRSCDKNNQNERSYFTEGLLLFMSCKNDNLLSIYIPKNPVSSIRGDAKEEVFNFDLKALAMNLKTVKGSSERMEVPLENMILEKESSLYKIVIYLSDINGEFDDKNVDKLKYFNVNGMMFIKKKI